MDDNLNDRMTRVLGRPPTLDEQTAAYLGAKSGHQDSALWVPRAKVIKYDPDTVASLTRMLGHEPTGPELRSLEKLGTIKPDAVDEHVGNLLTTAGLNRITNLIIGGGGAAFTNAQAFAGVGDSTTTATVADTALGAATNKWYQAADATNPTQLNGLITMNCTLGSANGNYAWQEWVWGIATGTLTAGSSLPGTSPILLNHKIQSMGTKVSGSIWTLNATITLA